MIRGTLVSTKTRCRQCLRWKGREDGSDWNYRVLWSSRWCGGVAAEPARAAEGSAGGRGTDGISERMEQET